MFQVPLALKLSARTILVDLQSVRAARGLDAESIIAMVDNARHPDHLRFVFNVGLGEARELRFWTTEIIAPESVTHLGRDEVINLILGQRETFRRSEIEIQWVISALHISNLVKSGQLLETKEGPTRGRLLRSCLANFLRSRWIGGPQ